jgi:hypothetical protein
MERQLLSSDSDVIPRVRRVDAHPSIFSINRYRNRPAPDRTEIAFDPGIAEKEVRDTLQIACLVLIGAVVAFSNIIDRRLQTDEFHVILSKYKTLFQQGLSGRPLHED